MTSAYRPVFEVHDERARQDQVWGQQNHPDGTGRDADLETVDATRRECEQAEQRGALTWRHILAEEVDEAFAETDPARLRGELLQVAAVAAAWMQAIDRRACDGSKDCPSGEHYEGCFAEWIADGADGAKETAE